MLAFRLIDYVSLKAIGRLEVRPDQAGLVTPNIWTLAQATYEPGACVRGLWDGDRPVGLIAMIDPRLGRSLPDHETDTTAAYLWRLMIADGAQGNGFGTAALAEAEATARRWGFDRLTLTVAPDPGNAQPFYERHGFETTGRVLYGGTEVEMAKFVRA